MSKLELLSCAGVPERAQTVAGAEFLSYSGGRDAVAVSSGQAYGSGSYAFGSSTTSIKQRYCIATFIIEDGRVTRINYQGRTGGLLTKDEQCAFIVENCASE